MQGLMFKPDLTIANLEGRKTRTSRMKGLKYINEDPDQWSYIGNPYGMFNFDSAEERVSIRCPFGQVGSELYGKETFQTGYALGGQDENGRRIDVIYKAGNTDKFYDLKWRSPMMMPESASRYHIILEKIVFQRIQEITEADSRAEGVLPDLTKNTDGWRTLIDDFRKLWDSINHNWDSNPWVWGLYYRVVKKEGK